ncbi:MAG: hypothetical protein R3F56_14215 [Planctomycetota bacterium]
MTKTARIAIVWQSATPIDPLLRALAGPWTEVRTCVFGDAVHEGDAIHRFQPRIVVVGLDAPSDEEIGALRLLGRLLPEAALVVTCPSAPPAAGKQLAHRLGAPLVAWPPQTLDLKRAVDTAAGQGAPGDAQALLNLTLGISDEVNNPLQSALGHLRLLEHELAQDDAKRARVEVAIRSLRRIQTTLERTRHLQRAAELPRQMSSVDLGAVLGDLMPGNAFPPTLVAGDRELLTTALRDLGAVGRDLAPDDQPPSFALAHENGHAIVRLRLAASRLADWQLPRTFEPYYLSRLLRGTTHGLKLFGVHHIVTAHGGRARAWRPATGGLVFELILPGADVSQRDDGQAPAAPPAS